MIQAWQVGTSEPGTWDLSGASDSGIGAQALFALAVMRQIVTSIMSTSVNASLQSRRPRLVLTKRLYPIP